MISVRSIYPWFAPLEGEHFIQFIPANAGIVDFNLAVVVKA